jgi:hypothetical protein
MIVSMDVKTIHTLQRLHNFTYRSVIPSPIGDYKSLHSTQHTLPLVYDQEIITKSFTTFLSLEN